MTPTGEMREVVQVQRPMVPPARDRANQATPASDDSGFETVATWWAKVEWMPANTDYQIGQGQQQQAVHAIVTIRRTDLHLTPRYRFLWDDTQQSRQRVLNIIQVGESPDKFDFIAYCSERQPPGPGYP